METKPITEDFLQQAEQAVRLVRPLYVGELVAEVRRLRSDRDRIDGEILPIMVERDNLRKMLEDANQREQLQLQAAQALAGVHKAAVDAMRLRDEYQVIKRGAEEGEVEYFERRQEAWEAVRAADLVLKEALAAAGGNRT